MEGIHRRLGPSLRGSVLYWAVTFLQQILTTHLAPIYNDRIRANFCIQPTMFNCVTVPNWIDTIMITTKLDQWLQAEDSSDCTHAGANVRILVVFFLCVP